MDKKEMLLRMFSKQDELNKIIKGDNWKQLNLPWYRAIWIECSELMNYNSSWKWWTRNGRVALEEMLIELVDIWHFGMSSIMNLLSDDENQLRLVIDFIIEEFEQVQVDSLNIHDVVEEIASSAMTLKLFDVVKFIELCKILNVDLENLYKLYIGKNILNTLRQDLGYKFGKYNKIWNGHEDNFYLIKLVKEMDVKSIEQNLYKELEKYYFQYNTNT